MAGAFGKPRDEAEIVIDGLDGVDESPWYVPAGDHPAKVTLCEPQTSSAGNPMLVFTFTISSGVAKGKDLKVHAVRTPAAMWKLKEVLKALGLDVSAKSLKIKPSALVGKAALLVVADQEFNGEIRSNVKKVKPLVAA